MKKATKRLAALMMALCMSASLAGCGQDQGGGNAAGGGSTATGGSESAAGSEDTGGSGDVGSAKEFEYFGMLWDPYQQDTPIYEALQEATGIKVNFTWSTQDAYSTLLAARMADKDLPDVIGYGVESSMLQGMIDEGLIIPLTDLLEEKMPNYMRNISDEDYLYMINERDGEVYAFGMLMDVPGSYSYMVRQDWLDRVNLDVPETWDEWVEVWTAFKEQDANGNGDPNDEIPVAWIYSLTYFLENIYGIESNGTYSVVDGKYVYDPEHPLYGEWLDAMRDLYEKGLISQEYLDIDTAMLDSLVGSNRVGSSVSYAVLSTDGAKNALEIDEDAYFICTPPIIGPYGDQMIQKRPKLTLNTYITKAAVDEGKLDTILEFFDFVFSDEGIRITNYGIEGETYEMVDGKPSLLEPYSQSFTTAREYGLIPTPIAFCFTQDVYNQILYLGQSYEEMDKYSRAASDGLTTLNEPYFYTRPVSISTDASSEYADLMEDQKSLRDQYIMGMISKDDYNKGYEALKEQGLNEVIAQADAAYQNILSAAD